MKKSYLVYLAVGIILVGLFLVIGRGLKEVKRTEFLMDTIVSSEIHVKSRQQGEEALDLAFSEMARLENILDRFIATSEVAAINRAAGTSPVTVSAETFDVIRKSLQVGEQTAGAFDITIAPLMRLWNFGGENVSIPGEEELAEARKLVNYQKVQLNAADSSVFLTDTGAQLDLGGIAKGYIVDRAADILIAHGITSASIDGGGDIRVIGSKPGGNPWRIGVRHPRDRRDIIAIVNLHNQAIVTSGDYERFFMVNDVRYHHILDPATGMPARGVISVTVIAPDAFTADAWSTALFVLGLEAGMKIIEELPEIDAILITDDEEVHISSGLVGKVEVRK
jgi:FAD:protein FMN transferase